ncbi:hypothetical protein Tco_1200011 [Tanacetum coccineum]
MFPFERYMKKLKGYVRNKAKPEGLIAKGYVAEEALTFSSHYFRDVTMKFNRPGRNVDPPPPTCQFQVFRSLCKSIGLRLVIWFDAQELKKVIWYVLHNSPEIDTYRSQFKRYGQMTTRLRNVARVMAVTVASDDRPLHTQTHRFLRVCFWATEVRAPENPIWVWPVLIRFEFGDRETLMPLGDIAVHWANYLGGCSLGSCRCTPFLAVKLSCGAEGGVMARIGVNSSFDMRPHMESDRWPLIYAAIQQHLQKIYKWQRRGCFKERHGFLTGRDVHLDASELSRPSHISEMESSATRDYPSLIHTFFLTHTVNGVFLNPEDKALYEDAEAQGLGSNTNTDMCTVHSTSPPCNALLLMSLSSKERNVLTRQGEPFHESIRSDDKLPQMLTQLESQPEIGGWQRDEAGAGKMSREDNETTAMTGDDERR